MAGVQIPPGPPPAKDMVAQLRLLMLFRKDTMGTLIDWRQQYGETYGFEIGKWRQYVFTHPDHLHEILVTQAAKFHKNDDYKNPKSGLARFLGNGLLISDGEFWKRQRKLVAPALHARRIGSYAETIVDHTRKMLDGWRDGARLDISQEMTSLTMRIVARVLFNTDVSADIDRVGDAVEALQRYTGRPQLLPTWVPTPDELGARRARRNLDAIVYRIIAEWHATGEDRGDLLSMLLMAEDDEGQRMTDQQARDEVVTLFLAGHETTANALNWTWYLLAQHPDIEAKLHHELDSVLDGQPPTLIDLDRLPYTEKVLKESMRLYPPAWGISREAIEDVEIGGYPVAKGTIVGMLTYFTHHDPRWFPDPERFDPERFTPENEAKLPRYAYLPFGGGPRICVGNAFAMMEGRLILATIASRYRLTLNPGQTVQMQPLITLNPKGGLPMTIQVRERETVLSQT